MTKKKMNTKGKNPDCLKKKKKKKKERKQNPVNVEQQRSCTRVPLSIFVLFTNSQSLLTSQWPTKKKEKSYKHRSTQKVTITQYKVTNYGPHNTSQSQSIKCHEHNTPQFIKNAEGRGQRGPEAEQYSKDKKTQI